MGIGLLEARRGLYNDPYQPDSSWIAQRDLPRDHQETAPSTAYLPHPSSTLAGVKELAILGGPELLRWTHQHITFKIHLDHRQVSLDKRLMEAYVLLAVRRKRCLSLSRPVMSCLLFRPHTIDIEREYVNNVIM